MYTESAILSLYFESPLHAGSGTSTGAIDLPIQRERITSWPMIQSSGLKGALRATMEEIFNHKERIEGKKKKTDERIKTVLGEGEGEGEEGNAGAISVSDAKLLLFPVRSSIAPFLWVTCPSILARLRRDLRRANVNIDFDIPIIEREEALMANKKEDKVILEDLMVNVKGEWSDAKKIIEPFLSDDKEYGFFKEKIKSDILLLNDEDFTFLVDTATEVTPRIVINDETKTTENLWYQELLPSDTLMYVVVFSMVERRKDTPKSAQEVMALLKEHLPYRFQIGGDETLGRGWVISKWI